MKKNDLTKIKRKDFIENGIDLIWQRIFNGDLYQIAEAIYPGQFIRTSKGQIVPKPLEPSEINEFITGTTELAVGRTFLGNIDHVGNGRDRSYPGDKVFAIIEDDPNQGIVLNIYKDYKKTDLLDGKKFKRI